VFAFVQRLEVAHMAKIQNLKDIHVWEVDVLQNQIFRLILNLQTFTPFDAWGKRPMTTTKQSNLEELELEHRCYEYHEHQYAQRVYDELQSLHQIKVQFIEDLAKKWCINEKLHQAMLDQNARLEKEYQQMMLASLVSTSSEA
jgi:hypothetical protein